MQLRHRHENPGAVADLRDVQPGEFEAAHLHVQRVLARDLELVRAVDAGELAHGMAALARFERADARLGPYCVETRRRGRDGVIHSGYNVTASRHSGNGTG